MGQRQQPGQVSQTGSSPWLSRFHQGITSPGKATGSSLKPVPSARGAERPGEGAAGGVCASRGPACPLGGITQLSCQFSWAGRQPPMRAHSASDLAQRANRDPPPSHALQHPPHKHRQAPRCLGHCLDWRPCPGVTKIKPHVTPTHPSYRREQAAVAHGSNLPCYIG